jgi:hypothetical protein
MATAMQFSPPSLHPPIALSDAQMNEVRANVQSFAANLRKRMLAAGPPAAVQQVTIPLTTVSLAGNFDAYINVLFRGQSSGSLTSLIVDSGNSNLIVPSWDALAALPGYAVLGEAKEPWGSPAKVVRGPIDIPTADGGTYSLEDVVFYACTGEPRTANFGAGCITPWSANGWNTPLGLGVTMQSPLSYNGLFPFAEFNYAAASNVLRSARVPTVAYDSELILSQSPPLGVFRVRRSLKSGVDGDHPEEPPRWQHRHVLAGQRPRPNSSCRYRWRSRVPQRPERVCLRHRLAAPRNLPGVGFDL